LPSESAILECTVLLPAAGAVVLLALPARIRREWPRGIATLFTLGTLFLSCLAARALDWTNPNLQFIPGNALPIGVDAFSQVLLLAVTVVAFLACWASYGVRLPRETGGTPASTWHVKAYFATLLFVEAMSAGALVVSNTIWFAAFLAAAAAAVYLLIVQWGHERREAAARRWLFAWGLALVLLCASLLIAGARNDMSYLFLSELSTRWPLAFGAAGAGLAIMIALVPLHRWLPDVLSESTTPVGMVVAGVMQLVGGYAVLRILFPLFGDVLVDHARWLGLAGSLAAVYAALAILGGVKDLRRIIACVATAQMGFFLLGLATRTASGTTGACLLLIAHAISIAMLLVVAGMIRDRTGHCDLSKLGGLGEHMPGFGAWAGLAFLAAMGTPGLSVFPGELLVVMGAFDATRAAGYSGGTGLWPGILGILAMALLAGALLWTYQRVFLGPGRAEHSNVAPPSFTEKAVLAMLGILSLLVGILPMMLTEPLRAAVERWLRIMGS
jgi:NADH-quinone oxidoreductase subunit M